MGGEGDVEGEGDCDAAVATSSSPPGYPHPHPLGDLHPLLQNFVLAWPEAQSRFLGTIVCACACVCVSVCVRAIVANTPCIAYE